jgi:hypothetical protein
MKAPEDYTEYQDFITSLVYDPSEDKVIGVTDDNCHVLIYHEDKPVVLLIPTDVFHETWDNWIEGKRRMCESYDHYCGVLGYTWIEDGEFVEDSGITIFHNGVEVDPYVIQVWEFSHIHDFEHG